MQTSPGVTVLLGSFNLGGGEIVVVLAIVLMLFWSGNLPRIAKWLWGDDARDAGRSLGGIFGKRAAQALTPDNKVAELYRPGVFEKRSKKSKRRRSILRALSELWSRLLSRLVWK
jgi:Sec-independent protein translocase protein TatA